MSDKRTPDGAPPSPETIDPTEGEDCTTAWEAWEHAKKASAQVGIPVGDVVVSVAEARLIEAELSRAASREIAPQEPQDMRQCNCGMLPLHPVSAHERKVSQGATAPQEPNGK